MIKRLPPYDAEIGPLVEQISALLTGKDPTVIGAVLGELVSLFVAGHHPLLRETVLEDFVALVDQLVPLNSDKLLKEFGGQWPRQQ